MSADVAAIRSEAVMRPHQAETGNASSTAPAPLVPAHGEVPPALDESASASAEASRTDRTVRDVTERAVESLNEVMETFDKGIRFRLHEDTDLTYVQVVNRNTKEVMREYPPKEWLDYLARFHEMVGLLLDKQV